VGATALLVTVGQKAEAQEQAHWLLASAAVAAFMYCLIFTAFFFRFPAILAQEQTSKLADLDAQTGYSFVPTFQVKIEAVPKQDADRKVYDTEILYRVAIKNTHVRTTINAYAVLEDMPQELGISPAAKLKAMGKGNDATSFEIAPTETVYLPLLERHDVRDQPPLLVFAAGSSQAGTPGVMTSLLRNWSRTGELKSGNSYDGTVVVHGSDALSSRVRFSVMVDSDGEPNVKIR